LTPLKNNSGASFIARVTPKRKALISTIVLNTFKNINFVSFVRFVRFAFLLFSAILCKSAITTIVTLNTYAKVPLPPLLI